MNAGTVTNDKSVPIEIVELIGRLYDAALNPALWTEVLKAIADYFDARHALLFDENFVVMSAEVFLGSVPFREQMDLYNNKIVFNNPLRIPILLTQKVGDIFNPTDLVPAPEYQATRYFKEYIEPTELGDGLIALLDKSTTKFDMFIVARWLHQPYFNEEERGRLRLLVPHIQKAFLINRALAESKKQVADLRDAVDEVSTAIFFLEKNGKLAHMNTAARRILTRNDLLNVELDVLKAIGAENQAKFAEALAVPLAFKTEFLLRSEANEDYVVRILPLAAKAATASGASAATAMAFVKRVEVIASSSIELIAERYKLTPREMTVLVTIVETGGVPETAAMLGLGQGTIRGHLKNVFAKTGLSKQLELAKLVSSYSS
jgi:DNA-binding CsgD family transcriptional regulator